MRCCRGKNSKIVAASVDDNRMRATTVGIALEFPQTLHPHQLDEAQATSKNKLKMPTNDDYTTLDERLKSFTGWPLVSPSADELAHHGFYYNPSDRDSDRVACYLCSVAVNKWKQHDTPLDRHRQAYCECPLVTIYTMQSYPLRNDVRQARRATFGKWWPHGKLYTATPFKLAGAGFVYAPTEDLIDRCECLYCHVRVSGWLEGDEPLHVHTAQSPDCPFILEVQGTSKMQASEESVFLSPKMRQGRSVASSNGELNAQRRLSSSHDVISLVNVAKPVELSKRKPGRPRKASPAVDEPELAKNVRKSTRVSELQPPKKRKYSVGSQSEEAAVSSDDLNSPVLAPTAAVAEIMGNQLNDVAHNGRGHIRVGLVMEAWRKAEQEFKRNLSVASLQESIDSMPTPTLSDAPIAILAHNQNGLSGSRRNSVLDIRVEQMQSKHQEETAQLLDTIDQLTDDVEAAREELAIIKKDNLKLKQQTSVRNSVSATLPRGGGLLTLPVEYRRRWFEGEMQMFEQRLGLVDGQQAAKTLVHAKPEPFLTSNDVPWPVSPSMQSVGNSITAPMITSFLLSDLSKQQFDDFSQMLCQKFHIDAVKQWIHLIVDRERQAVLSKTAEVWHCMSDMR